jgi:hypothetical protein
LSSLAGANGSSSPNDLEAQVVFQGKLDFPSPKVLSLSLSHTHTHNLITFLFLDFEKEGMLFFFLFLFLLIKRLEINYCSYKRSIDFSFLFLFCLCLDSFWDDLQSVMSIPASMIVTALFAFFLFVMIINLWQFDWPLCKLQFLCVCVESFFFFMLS